MKKTIIVLSAVLIAGCALSQTEVSPTQEKNEVQATIEIVGPSVETVNGSITIEKIDALEVAFLDDVTGGDASGVAKVVSDSPYEMEASFENLPAIAEDFFYEGWVVRQDPLSIISTGPTEEVDGAIVNTFSHSEDLSDHTRYVLTLEPDDGDPAPAAHVVEGDFVKQ